MILQIVCRHPSCGSSIALPGIRPLMKMLDSGAAEFLELVLDILCNITGSVEGKLQILSSGGIPKLFPHLSDGRLAGSCLKLMHSLCEVEEGKVAIAETDGCITAIVELLDSGSREEQEHSVAILLSLCSYCSEYCSLVMKEGIIPSLVHVSINGNSQGKDSSMKLLHVLRDIRDDDYTESSLSHGEPSPEPPPMPSRHAERGQPAPRRPGFLRKMFFSKPKIPALF